MRKYTLTVGWNTNDRYYTLVERQVIIKAITNDISYVITSTSGIPSTTVVDAPKVLMGAELTVTVPAGSYLWFAGTGTAHMLVKGPATGVASGTFAPSALKGFGRIKRTADLVCAANTFVSLFQNCILTDTTGTAVTVDSNGYFVVPAGVEYIRLSTSQFVGSVPASISITMKVVTGAGVDLTTQYSMSTSSGTTVTPIIADIFKVTPGQLIGVMIRFSSAYTLRSDLTYTWNVGSYELFGQVSSAITQGKSNFLGFAEIRRTTNTLFTANTYQELMRGCVMESALGNPGVLQANGRITVPQGAKYCVINYSTHTSGHASDVFTRKTKNGTDDGHIRRYSANTSCDGSYHFNCEGLTDVGVVAWFNGANYTSGNFNGSIEFYTAEQSEEVVLPASGVNTAGSTPYWNGAIRRASATQNSTGSEVRINLPSQTKVSNGFNAAQTVSGGIVIPPGVTQVRARFGVRSNQPVTAWAEVWRAGVAVSRYWGLTTGYTGVNYMTGQSSIITVLPGDVVYLYGNWNGSLTVFPEHDNASWLEVESVLDQTAIPVPETPLLMGWAMLQRDSNLLLPTNTWTPLLQGCSFRRTSGIVGTLNSTTGKIILPSGCKGYEQNLHVRFAVTSTAQRALRVWVNNRPAGEENTAVNAVSGPAGGVWGHSAVDVVGATEAYPMITQLSGSSIVIEASHYEAKDMGIIKFYR